MLLDHRNSGKTTRSLFPAGVREILGNSNDRFQYYLSADNIRFDCYCLISFSAKLELYRTAFVVCQRSRYKLNLPLISVSGRTCPSAMINSWCAYIVASQFPETCFTINFVILPFGGFGLQSPDTYSSTNVRPDKNTKEHGRIV